VWCNEIDENVFKQAMDINLGGLKTLIKKLNVAAPWNVAMEAVDRAVRVAMTTLISFIHHKW